MESIKHSYPHRDPVTGFEATSPSLFFGSDGVLSVPLPSMTLFTDCHDRSILSIHLDEFMFLNWCIARITHTILDDMENHRFSAAQWRQILAEGDVLLAMTDYEAFYAYLVDCVDHSYHDRNDMLVQLNTHGEAFWNARDVYRLQLQELRQWSNLVLEADDTMNIHGF